MDPPHIVSFTRPFRGPDVSFGSGFPRFAEKKVYAGTLWIDDLYLAPLDPCPSTSLRGF